MVKEYFLIVLAITVLSALSFAADRPDWLTEPVFQDAQYKYYIGRASHNMDEGAAFNKATTNAYEQAIRFNYGINTQITSQTCSTIVAVGSMVKVSANSDTIHINGFEQVKNYVDDDNGGIRVIKHVCSRNHPEIASTVPNITIQQGPIKN